MDVLPTDSDIKGQIKAGTKERKLGQFYPCREEKDDQQVRTQSKTEKNQLTYWT